jgi:hypothetical protein
MNIDIKSIKGEDCACDALIFLFPENGPEGLKKLPRAIGPVIKQVFSKEFSGRQNEVFLMKAPDTVKPERLLPACRIFSADIRRKDTTGRRQGSGISPRHGYEKGCAFY